VEPRWRKKPGRRSGPVRLSLVSVTPLA